MENLAIPQGMDPGAVNLARAIRQQESGGDYNKPGDNGSSLGAYQWNNQPNGKSIPLQKDEIPSNFQNDAKEFGLDPTDFSAKNQDMVAYNKIKKLKDEGKNVVDIAAIWNGGDAKRQDPNYVTPSGLPSQKKGVYDVPAYAKAVNDYYQNFKSKSSDNQTEKTLTFDDIPKTSQANDPTAPGNVISDLSKGDYGNALQSGIRNVGNFLTAGGSETLGKTLGTAGGALYAKGKDLATGSKDYENYDLSAPSPVDTAIAGGKVVAGAAGTKAIIEGAGGLLTRALSSGKALLGKELPSIIKEVSPQLSKAFETETVSGKFNLLTDLLNKVPPADKKVLEKALEELTPLVEKEKGLTPGLLKKVLSKTSGLSKKIARGLITASGLGGGALSLYDHYTK